MPAPRHYSLYGLIVSSPLALPCPTVARSSPPDVRLAAGRAELFSAARSGLTAAHTLDDWFWCRRLADGGRYLRWGRHFEFIVSPDGGVIRYGRLENGSPESLRVYLLGPVLSFSLLARGVEPLHGTAVAIGGTAVGFLGDSGRGKSTLAAALLRLGCPVLSDDVLALARQEGAWTVEPGIPRLKLFPSMARQVLGSTARHPRMNGGTSKLVVPLGPGQAAGRVLPLGTLYVLSDPDADSEAPATGGEIRIDSMPARDAFFAILAAAFNLVVSDRARIANQFTFASSLAAGIRMRRLTYPRRLADLAEVCRAVMADSAPVGREAQASCAAGTATT